MKRHLLWTFDRGSFQWDVLCCIILAFLFLIPRDMFNDVPEYMKVSATEKIRRTVDRNGSMIFTARLEEPCLLDTAKTRDKAVAMVEHSLGERVKPGSRIQPIRNWTGRLIAYAIWKER